MSVESMRHSGTISSLSYALREKGQVLTMIILIREHVRQ